MVIEEIIIALIAALVGGALVWIFFKHRVRAPAADTSLHERLDRFMQAVDTRLNESKSFLAGRVDATERTVRAVHAGLGKLETATAALHKTNEEISSFQKMLTSPKIRGSFGEVLLGNLLADVLPADRYELQYAFKHSGAVADAVIKLQDGYIVAVDAKFPLANFQTENRPAFLRDVKKHIQDISKKYISPRAQTLDYAFMYIPLEAVYYETIIHDKDGETLWDFCIKHKVVPVSPNSFLAYLQTVLVGLKGMKVQEQAKEILANIGQLRRDFGPFVEDYAMIGKHLTNAKNRYEDSSRRLDKFTNRLDQIDTGNDQLPVGD